LGMAYEWVETTIGDAADLSTGFPFKSDQYTEDQNAIRLVRGDNVVQGTLRWDGVKSWPLSAMNGLESYLLEENDVVLAMDRPWIEAGLKYASIRTDDLPCLLVQRVARLRAKKGVDQRFLMYIIGSSQFTQYVLGIQTGTAVPHISASQIRDFHFSLPPIKEQQAIAHILGSLDDRIELNRQMNTTLEAMARALFKSWFVDFDPVHARAAGRQPIGMDAVTAALFPDSFEPSSLGELPRGWRVSTVGDEVRVVGGSTPSTKEPAYWEGGAINWATPKDLSGLADPVLLHTERRITEAGLSCIGSGLFPTGTILLSSRAPIGYLAIADIPVAINQGFIAMVCDGGLPNLYVLNWARENMDTIVGRANGTTFLEVSKANFRPIQVLVSPHTVLAAFVGAVEPIYRRIAANLREAETLAAIRDGLLPRLLSGEVMVGGSVA
jgi:type I restriction enzyme S subunit